MAVLPAGDQEKRQRQRLRDADRLYHLHSFTDHKALAKGGAFMVERAEGCRIEGEGGIVLLDAVAGLGCVNIGYGRAEMAETAAAAMRRLAYYHTFQAVTNPEAAALAEKIAELAPGSLERVFFANSGSEANETIVKLVRAYWRAKGEPQRRVIISRDQGYHGSSLFTAGLTGLPYMHEAFGLPLDDVAHVRAPYWYREGGGLTPEAFGREAAAALARKIEEIGPEHVAAFIAEPVQVTAGAIIPPDSYWPEIVRICRDAGILLIADEVVTGFGRTGVWFAQSHYGFEADLMACAKGLASAYVPIAAAVASEAVADVVLSADGPFQHGFTTSGHPVACAVARRNIEIIERENLVATAAARGRYLARRLATLAEHRLVGEVRSLGLLAGIELVRDKTTRSHYPLEAGVCGQVANACLMRGVIVRPTGNSLVLCPPFVISEGEIDLVVSALGEALDEAAAKLPF
ncbi:MAG: aminotransferase [Rhodothalassiaceae bacterium]